MTKGKYHVGTDGSIYADTAFMSASGALPGCSINHMGFGEFFLETPEGELEFDRMRGIEFPGQSGRSHKLYPAALAASIVKTMETNGLSEKV